jgi:hypothetical protein
MKTKFTITLLMILAIGICVTAQTTINEGQVEGIWTADGSPYVVEGAINVPFSKTLIIDPGVVVKFNTKERFEINGCLIAEGTAEDSILFTNNNLLERWGGIKWINTLSTNDSSKIAYCIFERAYAYGPGTGLNSGAAIAVKSFDKLSIRNSTFRNNLVDLPGYYPPSGGAIALWNSSISISHCVFHNNTANYGGAILYYMGSDATTDNCLFYDNTANKYGGAVEVFDNGDSPYFINCTFSDNHATIAGGAFDIYESIPNVTNSILWGNTSGVEKTEVHMRWTSSGLNVYHSDIQNGEMGFSGYVNLGTSVNMLDSIPEFLGTKDSLFPYSIHTSSVCADFGTLDTLYLPENWVCPAYDLADHTRCMGGSIDLGAFETSLVTGVYELPDNADLNVNVFPNPASSDLFVNFNLKKEQKVTIKLYSLDGQLLNEPVNQLLTPGQYQYQLSLNDLPGGYYLLQLKAGNTVETKKVIKR